MMFEDLAVGDGDTLGEFLFTEADIVRFGRHYDPQPFHIDATAARASPYGGLIASGWHVAAVWMKLTVAYQKRRAAEEIAAGRRPGSLGPSPGFRNLVWARPVRPGDKLTYSFAISGLRPSASRPSWGLVEMKNSAVDGSGTPVFAFDGLVFWERRT